MILEIQASDILFGQPLQPIYTLKKVLSHSHFCLHDVK